MTLENYCAAGGNGWEVVVKIVKLSLGHTEKKCTEVFSAVYALLFLI